MKTFISLLFIFAFALMAPAVLALENPLSVSNNRFGIHLVDENDIPKAAELVNSNGGDWGYVTLVIREDDRDQVKWQRIFDKLREAHLIPLVRLATVGEGQNWRAPKPEDAASWATFLNSLNWAVKNRYVILFNEPNHAKEWGGTIKPAEFAVVVKTFTENLKNQSSDFFILPGAVDSAAPNSSDTMSASQFYKWMLAADPQVFTYYDGLVSHAYPHPDFIGRLTDRGPGTITSYRWEQAYLKSLGLSATLPVFITETGWAHNGGLKPIKPALKPEKLVNLYSQAFTSVWTDPQIVAITPFILNYQDAPFDQFSWTKPGGIDVYPHYRTVQDLKKVSGQPSQIQQAEILPDQIPLKLVAGSVYNLPLLISNLGQNIWSETSDRLIIKSPLVANQTETLNLPSTKPLAPANLSLYLRTPLLVGTYPVQLYYQNQNHAPVLLHEFQVNVINPPSLYVQAKLWFKRQSSGADFTLLIYQNGDLLKKIHPFTLENGHGELTKITDVIPNRNYRFVILKPYYLPTQTFATLNESVTQINFGRLLPFDLYPDGQLTLKDISTLFTNPLLALFLWQR